MSRVVQHAGAVVPGTSPSHRGRDVAKKFRRQWRLLLFLLPGILCYLVFSYLPMAGIVVAFQDFSIFKGFFHSPFVGLKWFDYMIHNVNFVKVVTYTLYMSITKLLVSFPAPILLALMLNELRWLRFKKLVQTLSYLPHFLSWVVVAIIVYRALDPSSGILVPLLSLLGFKDVGLLTQSKFFVPIIVVSDIWKEVGFSTIFYLAALTTIDPTLYQVAAIDGAGKYRQLLHITLPGIAPTAVMLLILSVGGIVNANFDQVYNLQNPLIALETDVINTFIFKKAIQQGFYSFSTAFGLMQGIVSFILIFMTNRISKKISGYGIY